MPVPIARILIRWNARKLSDALQHRQRFRPTLSVVIQRLGRMAPAAGML